MYITLLLHCNTLYLHCIYNVFTCIILLSYYSYLSHIFCLVCISLWVGCFMLGICMVYTVILVVYRPSRNWGSGVPFVDQNACWGFPSNRPVQEAKTARKGRWHVAVMILWWCCEILWCNVVFMLFSANVYHTSKSIKVFMQYSCRFHDDFMQFSCRFHAIFMQFDIFTLFMHDGVMRRPWWIFRMKVFLGHHTRPSGSLVWRWQ